VSTKASFTTIRSIAHSYLYLSSPHFPQVAVKILFCMELTPDRVKSFCSEASMLHSLAHPNIVICHGVAVMPPAICLVTEWCHHGSLYDLLHTSEYYIRDSYTSRPSRTSRGNRLSLNLRISTPHSGSGGDTDSINEITSDGGNPFEDLALQDDNHGNPSRKSPVTISPDFDLELPSPSVGIGGRGSFGGDLKVVSKRFHPTTTRSSLQLRTNLSSPGAAAESNSDDRDSPLKGMGMGDPGKPPSSLPSLSISSHFVHWQNLILRNKFLIRNLSVPIARN
jgi:hypothetical protein